VLAPAQRSRSPPLRTHSATRLHAERNQTDHRLQTESRRSVDSCAAPSQRPPARGQDPRPLPQAIGQDLAPGDRARPASPRLPRPQPPRRAASRGHAKARPPDYRRPGHRNELGGAAEILSEAIGGCPSRQNQGAERGGSARARNPRQDRCTRAAEYDEWIPAGGSGRIRLATPSTLRGQPTEGVNEESVLLALAGPTRPHSGPPAPPAPRAQSEGSHALSSPLSPHPERMGHTPSREPLGAPPRHRAPAHPRPHRRAPIHPGRRRAPPPRFARHLPARATGPEPAAHPTQHPTHGRSRRGPAHRARNTAAPWGHVQPTSRAPLPATSPCGRACITQQPFCVAQNGHVHTVFCMLRDAQARYGLCALCTRTATDARQSVNRVVAICRQSGYGGARNIRCAPSALCAQTARRLHTDLTEGNAP